MIYVFIVMVCLSACGDDDDPFHCDSSQHHLRVEYSAPTGSLSLRRNDAWERFESKTPYQDLCVDDDYVIGVMCGGEDFVSALQYWRTYADGDTVSVLSCAEIQEPAAVIVDGVMEQPGRVYIAGSGSQGVDRPWSYSYQVPAGTHDVVASDAYEDLSQRTNRVAIRRSRVYTRNVVEAPLDLDVEGSTMVELPLSVVGAETDDVLRVTTDIVTTSGDRATVSENLTATAYRIPAKLLMAGDRETVTLSARTPQGATQTHRRTVTTSGVDIALLPRLTGVTFEIGTPSSVTWSVLPSTYTELSLIEQDATSLGFRRVIVSRSWIELHGVSTFRFDQGMPGLDQRYQFVGATPQLTATAASAEAHSTTSITSPQ